MLLLITGIAIRFLSVFCVKMSLFYAQTRDENISSSHFPTKSQQQSGCGGLSIFGSMAKFVGMVPKGNMGNAAETGCSVDTQSSLLWGDKGTAREPGPKQTFPRPYATTPFLAIGNVEGIDNQTKVLHGHSTANRKDIQSVTDSQFPVFQPLLPQKEADIAGHNYFVEPFLRGGYASRLEANQRFDSK